MANKAKADDPEFQVKRIRPYPFQAMIDQNKPVDVVYLTQTGFLALVKSAVVSVGEHHEVHFNIPVLKYAVTARTRVLKTYDKSIDPKAHKVERMAEFHFENLDDIQRNNILSFLSAIGQIK